MPLLLWWTVVDFASATRYDHVLSPRIPRGGGVESEKRSATDNIEDILLVDEEGPYDDATNPEYYMHHRRRIRQKLPLPKRLLNVARNFIGRTADIILKPKRQTPEVDHTFDELDRILENNTNNTATGNILQEEEWIEETWPPLPSQRRKWWKERSLRLWIKQMEHKFVSKETATALRTIGNIIDAFPDYGVVDLFAMYSPKDVIWSIVALSRLQRVLEPDLDDVDEDDSNIITDRQLLEELAHYCSFANAAYGWKGLPFCGRLHLGGDNHVLIRSTGIRRRDIVATNWHAKANRPVRSTWSLICRRTLYHLNTLYFLMHLISHHAHTIKAYYIVRDRKRKAIVLGIRGTASPRDIVTDLCASAENFLVEDGPEIREIGEEEDSDVSTATPPLIVGRAHKGMVDGAKSVARVTGKVVSHELDAHPDYSLVIVGHSLGGLSCIFTIVSYYLPHLIYGSTFLPQSLTNRRNCVCIGSSVVTTLREPSPINRLR